MRLRTATRSLLILLGVVAVAFAATVLALHRPGPLGALLSSVLGVEVSISTLNLQLGGITRIETTGVHLGPAAPGEEPIGEIGRFDLELDL